MPYITARGHEPPVSDLLHWPPRRRPTRREGTIAALVSAPLLATALGAAFAPKLDAREPMQPIPREKMQIVLNQVPDTPLPTARGGKIQVLAPDMTAPTVVAAPRPSRVAYAAPVAAAPANLESRDAAAREQAYDRPTRYDDAYDGSYEDGDVDQPRDRHHRDREPLPPPNENEEDFGPPNDGPMS